MALDLNAIGKKIGPLLREYGWKDVVLYALGVGAGFEELEYVYENRLKVIPSFSVAGVFDFFAKTGTLSNADLSGILHGEQDTFFHNPIPIAGRLITEGRITHMYDKGKDKGAVVVAEASTSSSGGQKLFTNVITLFCRKDGGFGGASGTSETVDMPERQPDFEERQTPGENQPLLYRLSGDLFPLHVDPQFARASGFEKPIMHGLCTHGYACRAVIKRLFPGRPQNMKRFRARFSKPLYPGTPIITRIWKISDHEARFHTSNAESGEIVLGGGIVEWADNKPAAGASLNAEKSGSNKPSTADFDANAPERERAVETTVNGPSVSAVFLRMPESFQADRAAGVDAVFLFEIAGADGGVWSVTVRDGRCSAAKGTHANPTVKIAMQDKDFVDMITGKLNAMSAFTAGKLRIEGDLMKSQLILKLFKF